MEEPLNTNINEDLEEEIFIIPKKLKNNNGTSDKDNNKDIEIDDINVLTLCPIPKSINIDKIKEDTSNYMVSRINYYKHKGRSPYLEDEFSEYFTANASDGSEIGNGHCGMDVKTKHNEGIDAMCVIMNKDISNEKSLIQNFKSSGSNLDTLFKEQKDTEAVMLFMNDYSKKLEQVKKDKNLNELYILAYISTDRDIYIACFKLNISRIASVKSGGFVKGKKEDNYVNIIVDNFIDSKIGKVTLYKSKKRVELRLKKELLQEENVYKIYSMP
jgi:hypothetical protein